MIDFFQFIATIDFEATMLSRNTDVIEVGVAIFDRQETMPRQLNRVRAKHGPRAS